MQPKGISKRDVFRKYPDVVDIHQLCEMLGGKKTMCTKTAYRLLQSGHIRSFRIGRAYRIPKIYVIQYLFGTAENEEEVKAVEEDNDSVESQL